MITIAVDAETKERVREYADSAGVDLSTYVAAAIAAAMERDDRVARAFAPLDALIDEAETQAEAQMEADAGAGSARCRPPVEGEAAISRHEEEELDRALGDFFDGPQRRRGVA
jgi:thioesterase domain-containing protein